VKISLAWANLHMPRTASKPRIYDGTGGNVVDLEPSAASGEQQSRPSRGTRLRAYEAFADVRRYAGSSPSPPTASDPVEADSPGTESHHGEVDIDHGEPGEVAVPARPTRRRRLVVVSLLVAVVALATTLAVAWTGGAKKSFLPPSEGSTSDDSSPPSAPAQLRPSDDPAGVPPAPGHQDLTSSTRPGATPATPPKATGHEPGPTAYPTGAAPPPASPPTSPSPTPEPTGTKSPKPGPTPTKPDRG
jgi:hypothetical protein